ncbi:MAG: NAD(P)H-hydrate dehydratase [Clostridia bacterium]|nr:NAD(P)H-hydrate dehydratase [Clostridia bacterium]
MLFDDSKRFQYEALTPEEMRRTEQKAFDLGVPSILLMEHAAIAVVDELEKALGGSCDQKQVLFLCGTGNNGGDGLAAARLFAMRCGKPIVYMTGEPKTPDAKINRTWAEQMGIRVLNLRDIPAESLPYSESGFYEAFDGAVDALLGTGLHGEPDALTSSIMNAALSDFTRRKPVIAVDIPSGIDGTTGDAPGAFIHADVTVTFHAPKVGLFLTNHRDAVGKIVVADIGLWQMLGLPDAEPSRNVYTPRALRFLHPRDITAHKGECGRVLIYAGKTGMAGAAAMCAKAAVTAGAGLTTITCEKEIIPVLQTLVPNAMCMEIGEAIKNPPVFDVFAVGCGLGQSEEIWQNILKLWNPEKPSVWDADALNLLAKHEMKPGENAVITPHPGEAARLLGWPMDKIMADRPAAARALAEKYGCTAVLKSDVSVICVIEGEKPKYYLNTVGTPALAKGGSGDALTGILAALLHDLGPMSPFERTALACLWHGMAGIVGEEKYGRRELTTDQLISCLHDAERWGWGELPAPKCFR